MRSIRRFAAALMMSLISLSAHADLELGQTAPKLDIELVDGEMLTARQLEGKVVVHLFWATWCPVCRSELPFYRKLHDTYNARGLVVVAVSLDEDRREVSEFWRQHGYTFPVAMRSDDIRRHFGRITGTPTLYLVDRNGKVHFKHLGALPQGQLEEQIMALL